MDQYFDFIFWRVGFASGSYWELVRFDNGSEWIRIGLGFYWRMEGDKNDH